MQTYAVEHDHLANRRRSDGGGGHLQPGYGGCGGREQHDDAHNHPGHGLLPFASGGEPEFFRRLLLRTIRGHKSIERLLRVEPERSPQVGEV